MKMVVVDTKGGIQNELQEHGRQGSFHSGVLQVSISMRNMNLTKNQVHPMMTQEGVYDI
jgi:hypothetical protein